MAVFLLWITNMQENDRLLGVFNSHKLAEKYMEQYTFWDKARMRIEIEYIKES